MTRDAQVPSNERALPAQGSGDSGWIFPASLAARPGDTSPADLPLGHDGATARDALDAERWLDEGGSPSTRALSR